MKVAITRPEIYHMESITIARSYGFDTFFAPMILLRPVEDPRFDSFIHRLFNGEADFVIFTSANGVRYAFDRVQSQEPFINALNHTNVVAIGPKTNKSLKEKGITTKIIPKEYSSLGIVETLSPLTDGRNVEIIRSDRGNVKLNESLKRAGALVHEANVYTGVSPDGFWLVRAKELIKKILDGNIDVLTFTSGMTVNNLFEIANEMEVYEEIRRICRKDGKKGEMLIAVIGRETERALGNFGVNADVIPRTYTFEAMMDAIWRKINSSG
ncbi:MAG: uroporphyrinogen-III synthase [Candidatus Methanolliviera sp. GoM_oil]|nr:MAG: uroporphyrinogen-III synthase [Candidatus Methanolliviera sp. GoM_oil]